MARPVGTARHLGDDRWQLFIELPPDPLTGNRRRRSKVVRADSERAARKQIAAVTIELTATDTPAPQRRTVDELLDTWLHHHQAVPSTIEAWRDALRLYVRPHIGHRQVADITSETLDRLYLLLRTSGGKDGTPLSPATVRKAHTPLSLAFAQAVRWRWIPTNPVADAQPPAVKAKRPKVPAPELVRALIDKAEETCPDLGCYVHVAANLGWRRGEALGLQWRDVDLEQGTVDIVRVVELVRGRVTVVDRAKNESSQRVVQLGGRALAVLKSMRARHIEASLAFGVPAVANAFVFSDRLDRSEPWRPRTFNRRFAALRAGVPGAEAVKPHHLRHYMATRMLGAGYDVVAVAGRGGWSNPYTLLTVYAHWLPKRDAEAAEVLDAELG